VEKSERVTVICGTDRPDSNSMRVARVCARIYEHIGAEAGILNLQDVDPQWLTGSAYGSNVPQLEALLQQHLRGVQRLVMVVPEYNGSFPGILKYFMDACDHGEWKGKKVALVGVASGRGGNLRGADHLTGVLHYLGSDVLSKKVYISQVFQQLTPTGELSDPATLNELRTQAEAFMRF
jgi:chromate reductase, NAD(P)H dehydrogenase (quinone)